MAFRARSGCTHWAAQRKCLFPQWDGRIEDRTPASFELIARQAVLKVCPLSGWLWEDWSTAEVGTGGTNHSLQSFMELVMREAGYESQKWDSIEIRRLLQQVPKG